MRRTFSGYVLVLAALALPGHSAEAASPRYSYVTSRLRPSLRLFPSVEMRGQAVMIRVTHIDVPSLEVNVAGRNVGTWTTAALEAVALQQRGVARGVTAPRPSRHLSTRAACSSRRACHVFRWMALAGVRTRHAVEADVPRPARGCGVVGANRASRRSSRRDQALASLGRRPSRPPPTPEARDRIHAPGAPRRQRSTRGVRHRRTRTPKRSVETARGKRGPVAQTIKTRAAGNRPRGWLPRQPHPVSAARQLLTWLPPKR